MLPYRAAARAPWVSVDDGPSRSAGAGRTERCVPATPASTAASVAAIESSASRRRSWPPAWSASRKRTSWRRWPLSCPRGRSTRRFAPSRSSSERKSSQHRGPSARVRLDVLLGHAGSSAVGVEDGCDRAVAVGERDREPLCGLGRLARERADRARDLLGRRADDPAREVDEVAALAQQPPAAVGGIVEPVARPAGRRR